MISNSVFKNTVLFLVLSLVSFGNSIKKIGDKKKKKKNFKEKKKKKTTPPKHNFLNSIFKEGGE